MFCSSRSPKLFSVDEVYFVNQIVDLVELTVELGSFCVQSFCLRDGTPERLCEERFRLAV